MRRVEKRRKFNEAVLSLLYPPAPQQSEGEDDSPSTSPAKPIVNSFPDDSGDSSCSSESDDGGEAGRGEQKLTRAQRKRIRKKKLREESARRGKMIGPLLPSSNDDMSAAGVHKDETSDVRRNAKELSASNEHQGDAAASTKQRRLQRRRTLKKLAKEGLKSSSTTQAEQAPYTDE